jgi:Ser/Thr protein kinase RdoA (MazF antagonist)
VLADGLVRSLVGEWGLGAGVMERPVAGTMNEVVIVTTDAGKVVLRGHHLRDRGRVDFEHGVMAFARTHAVPVPAAIPTPVGDVVVERDGRFYSLFEYARGRQVPRDQLAADHTTAMGQALAQAHVALRGLPTEHAPRAQRPCGVEATLRGIERLLTHLAGISAPGEQEAWATERLRSRADWLDRHGLPVPVMGGGGQVIHGDYQDSNVFFAGGVVSAIIDWDKAEVRSPAEEAIRAMHLSLRLDPALCRAFLDGYRSASTLTGDQLDQAAVVYGYHRACDLWLYDTIFLHGDDRPRRFLTPGHFVPFVDQWDRLRATILA